MVQAGGPAAINGFLFQILNHLAWFADIRIGGTIAGHGIEADAYVVLEPPDGGDARYEAANSYVVEQYKTRPDGTWSVNAIIDDVLPDLRKAVREPPGQKGAYLFVTDGRRGRLKTFDSFLTSLRSCASPADIDNTQAFKFGEGLPTTQRMLFEHIVKETHSPRDLVGQPWSHWGMRLAITVGESPCGYLDATCRNSAANRTGRFRWEATV